MSQFVVSFASPRGDVRRTIVSVSDDPAGNARLFCCSIMEVAIKKVLKNADAQWLVSLSSLNKGRPLFVVQGTGETRGNLLTVDITPI